MSASHYRVSGAPAPVAHHCRSAHLSGRRRYGRYLWGGLLSATLVAGFARADTGDLGEIVVTAALRPLPILEFPASVAVLDAATLQAAGQQHLEDVLALVPNLNWAADTARPRYFQIRGIGELAQYQGAPNPSIGFLIDDIDFSGLGSAATLFDVDRIEVLRGPQGTRYGANALGGLIYVQSAAPEQELGGRVELELGDYNSRSYGAVLTGPVPALDSAFRLAVQRYTSDGYYTNSYLHRTDTARRDELTVRARWHLQASERLRIDLTLLRAQIDDGFDNYAIDNSRTTLSDQPGVDAQHSSGVGLRLNYDLSAATRLTALASYADTPSRYSYDGDWGNPNAWAPFIFESSEVQDRRRRTSNLELRMARDPTPRTSWVVGLYALELRESLADSIYNLYQDPTAQYFPPATGMVTTSRYRARSGALFAEFDQQLAPDIRLSVGGRREWRTSHYQDVLTATGAAPLARDFRPADQLWGGQLSLTWKPAEGHSVYGLVSRGYKAGGFNLSPGLPTNELEFRPESDWNAELGYKAQVRQQRLRFDSTLFYMRRQSLQLLTGTQLIADDPSTFVLYTGNAPTGFNYGVESRLDWEATAAIEIGVALGSLQTRYHGFTQNGVVLPDRGLPHSPHWQGALHVAWKDPGGRFARLELTGMGGFYFDLPPNPTSSAPYGLVNARIGIEKPRWSAAVWGRNLLDKAYAVRGFYFGDEPPNFPNKEYVQLGAPRTFGVNFTAHF
jgi:iron complex outermembrane recepter protein